ncbi:hypothetical protein PFICI_01657 [Pestalotiopsis fici W106-1]|uniref:Xylanolytic transcriptional activator regulatory domain-containing protein n=1 Tax=Pestalotiopsis fici (strain W106-1 / CGMCC3.15140) TaxID=1229662 RepID=W3XPD2_PESFW|nr:uncharacterized protein PFICI_01657 [Pestalotiopsis fici W106-1]ETS87829.1 hypothetical protein PFICI_01657 [Pestalotiopsis fici W106-1]
MRIHNKSDNSHQVIVSNNTNDAASLSGGSDAHPPPPRPDNRRVSVAQVPAGTTPSNEYAFTAPFSDLEAGLAWPDAEQLLQTIISSDWNSLTLPPETWPATHSTAGVVPDAQIDPRLQETHVNSTHNGESHMAIQSLSNMITNVSSRVTNAVETLPDLNPAFLNNCLQTYFTRFNPTFPVLHRPTFVFKECSPSLLLNAIALGSLFIGTEDAVSKGEALWRLAYTAVSTSWQSFMAHRGAYDSRSGFQLVLTALLGQTYAMLSKNESLRVTSQIYHSLSFNWARHCGMFDLDGAAPFNLPDPNDRDGLVRGWKLWVSRELQSRALLGHYILDGQLSFMSGQPTSVVHTANPLMMSSNSRLFDAQTADEWFSEMKVVAVTSTSFQDVYGALFQPPALDPALGGSSHLWNVQSHIDLRVILEGVHALIRETQDPLYVPTIWRPPSSSDISNALLQIRRHLEVGWSQNSVEKLGLLMRWHLCCLDAVVKLTATSKDLCRLYQIPQNLFQVENSQQAQPAVMDWNVDSFDAKRALLHATAIQDIAAQLPLSQVNSMWMPIPIFAAAMVSILFCLNGVSTVTVPYTVDWSVVLDAVDPTTGHDNYEDSGRSKTQMFFASNIQSPTSAIGLARNLRYELNSLQTIIHGLSVQWGVCVELEQVLQTLKAHCP